MGHLGNDFGNDFGDGGKNHDPSQNPLEKRREILIRWEMEN